MDKVKGSPYWDLYPTKQEVEAIVAAAREAGEPQPTQPSK